MPTMSSSEPGALCTECVAVPLALSHELRVDSRRLAAGGPFLSCWFGHPDSGQDRQWRMYVCREQAAQAARWALHLQLSTAEERAALFRRRPRSAFTSASSAVAAAVDDGVLRSQTDYILTGVDVKVVFRGGRSGASVERPPPARANFRALGYLDTVRPVLVTAFDEKWPANAPDDAKHLIIQLAFTVDHHKQVAVATS